MITEHGKDKGKGTGRYTMMNLNGRTEAGLETSEREARVARAHELHESGFNCAQAVACACADLAGIDEATAFKMTEGLGGGMGGFTETCGAVSGGCAIIGYTVSDGPHNPKTKGATYKQVRQLVSRFSEQNGSTLCKELKGQTGGPVLRSCPDCVDDGIRMTLDILESLS